MDINELGMFPPGTALWATPAARDHGGKGTHYATLPGQMAEMGLIGLPNMAWLLRLQGFPDGWLDEALIRSYRESRSRQASQRALNRARDRS